MKAAAAMLTAGLVALSAAPALAAPADTVRIRHAAARMVVIVENRADIGVEIEPGAAGLPRPTVRRSGDEVRIDGELGRNGVRDCRSSIAQPRQPGEGASVEVRDRGRIALADAPLVVVRAPQDVSIRVEGGAVYGSVGRGARELSLANAGCGDWTTANVDGAAAISLAGSGDLWAGSTRELEISLAGSGDVVAGPTSRLEASVAGSGSVTVARVDGPVEANIAGSGDVIVRGSAQAVAAAIAGSGDVRVGGSATNVSASIVGSGDVRVASVTGSVHRSGVGSGEVFVGP